MTWRHNTYAENHHSLPASHRLRCNAARAPARGRAGWRYHARRRRIAGVAALVTPAEFARRAVAVYGPQWKSALARDLGMSRVQMHSYATGQSVIPRKVELALKMIEVERRDDGNG